MWWPGPYNVVLGPDDNYDKVEQEVFAKHYLPGRWWWWLSYKKWN